MSKVYLDEALEILRYLRGQSRGVSVADILAVFPHYYRSKLTRYLAELERRGFVTRVRQPVRGRGREPDLWYIRRRSAGEEAGDEIR